MRAIDLAPRFHWGLYFSRPPSGKQLRGGRIERSFVLVHRSKTMAPSHVLIVSGNANVRERLNNVLCRQAVSVAWTDRGKQCLSMLESISYTALFVDLEAEGVDDELVRQAVSIQPRLSVVALAPRAVLDVARLKIRVPHTEFVAMPFLDGVVQAVLERAAARCAPRAAGAEAAPPAAAAPAAPEDWDAAFAQLVACSPAMRETIDLADRVAPTDAAVLIEGEIGTGKGLLAYRIHSRSSRCDGPFVRVACAALGDAGADEALFGRPGHNREAEAPAAAGLLGGARGGTLYLENVARLPFSTQVKLFEALQTGSSDWPDSPESPRPDVRVIASTREELKTAVAENRFYSALYYFLDVVPIRIPALRQRRKDIRPLAEHFLASVSRAWGLGSPPPHFNDEAWECLLGYAWPGNARQLAGIVARAAVLSQGPEIGRECIAELLRPGSPPPSSSDTLCLPLVGGLKAMERWIIEEMIHRCRGNKAAAARALGLHRRTLYRMLEEAASPLENKPGPTRFPVTSPHAAWPAAEGVVAGG
jgi:DNA-binding NtrC family response regulator